MGQTLFCDVLASLVLSVLFGAQTRPADMDVLVRFYSKVRPFGFWGPVRAEAVHRGLVPAGDRMPLIDICNGLLTVVFQTALAIVPFYLLLKQWVPTLLWGAVLVVLAVVLYWTWYRNLPSRDKT